MSGLEPKSFINHSKCSPTVGMEGAQGQMPADRSLGCTHTPGRMASSSPWHLHLPPSLLLRCAFPLSLCFASALHEASAQCRRILRTRKVSKPHFQGQLSVRVKTRRQAKPQACLTGLKGARERGSWGQVIDDLFLESGRNVNSPPGGKSGGNTTCNQS